MGKVSDDDTRVVLRKLACCFPAFYALYYGVAAILCAAFGLFDASPQVFGKMPFDFEAFGDFSFGEKPKLAAWLAMVITYVLGVGIIFFIVRSTRKAWDYAVTITFFHTIVSCAVTGGFPTEWVWWVTIVLCTVAMGGCGELSNYFCRDLRDIDVDHD